jgi:hypothetical protein
VPGDLNRIKIDTYSDRVPKVKARLGVDLKHGRLEPRDAEDGLRVVRLPTLRPEKVSKRVPMPVFSGELAAVLAVDPLERETVVAEGGPVASIRALKVA